MGISHSWNGTVLTITSDSGTSSADLKGSTGNTGPRGPQGKCGVILKANGTVDTSAYATEDYVDTKIEQAALGDIDLTSYATKSYVQEQIAGIEAGDVDLSDYYTKSQVDAKIPSLTGYATENFVTTKIAEAQLSGGGGEVDLSGYATQDWVNAKGYLTEHQSLKTINGESLVGSGNITISGGDADLSGYYTKTEIDNKGYLTEHQSLDNYYTKTQIDSKGYLTSHQSLKTINGQSIVGSGNITISGGSDVTPVTSISSSSTDNEIPSAKAVYTAVNNKYTKPSGGIPASDLASGVIPSVPTFSLSGTTLTITT